VLLCLRYSTANSCFRRFAYQPAHSSRGLATPGVTSELIASRIFLPHTWISSYSEELSGAFLSSGGDCLLVFLVSDVGSWGCHRVFSFFVSPAIVAFPRYSFPPIAFCF